MTLRELQTEVSALGFDSTVECDALFITSANRALGIIFDERCVTGDVRILAVCPPVLKHIDAFVHQGGEVDALPVSGRAYSMCLSGTGVVTIEANGEVRTESFNGKSVHMRGFINGDGKIIFSGDSGFTVSSFNVYGEIFGSSESDIPDGSELHFYDVSAMVDDFVSFVSPARDSKGNIIKNATLSDGKLIIRGEYNGAVHLTYRRSPARISSVLDTKIDVPREDEARLSILTAAFLWLDDDGEKARYYMQLYREFGESRKEIAPTTYGGTAKYVDVNGWA